MSEVEGRGIGADELARHPGANPKADMPPAVGSDGAAPPILYVPDGNGNLIPVERPGARRQGSVKIS